GAAACGWLAALNLLVERYGFVVLYNCQRNFIRALHALRQTLALGFVQGPGAGEARLLGTGRDDDEQKCRRQPGNQKYSLHSKNPPLVCSLLFARARLVASSVI